MAVAALSAPRAPAPLWLARPSRYARLSPGAARIAIGLLLLLLAASQLALRAPGPPPVSRDASGAASDNADVDLYETIIAGVRGGGNYYAVTAQALRSGDYPLKPFVTFRLPTLALVEAMLPPFARIGLLYCLAAGVVAAWYVRLRPAFARGPPRLIAIVLLMGGLVVFVQRELVAFHEIWAGLLVALSLALRRRDRWAAAVAVGLIAMLVRETAALYVAVMAAAALIEGNRRELLGWCGAVAVLAVVVALHAHAVAQVVLPGDPASPGWAGMLGFGFFVKTMGISTTLLLAPLWLAALLAALALFGWSAWADPLAARMMLILAVYALLLSLFGRTDTFYWGLMVAPAFLIGLAFVPDGLRDLAQAARRTRRITVTRVGP